MVSCNLSDKVVGDKIMLQNKFVQQNQGIANKKKKWAKPILIALKRNEDMPAETILGLCKRVWPTGGGGAGAQYDGCLIIWEPPSSCTWCFHAAPS